MLSSIASIAVLALSAFAAPLSTRDYTIPTDCQSSGQASIVFQGLDSDTLAQLNSHNLVATFFVSADWIASNTQLAKTVQAQGHSFGLAVDGIDSFVDKSTPNTDYPVRQDVAGPYFNDALSKWSNAYGSPPTVVVFIGASLAELNGAYMFPKVYGSLEQFVAGLGYTPVLAAFGQDYRTLLTAASSYVELANFFGAGFTVDYTQPNDPKTKLANDRSNAVNLDDGGVVAVTAQRLSVEQGVSIVPLGQCLGITIN
ncbi:hypothetical protein HDU79_003803 [Rhizoclosmatium sp. JEL0117]|nr:hypothetical protein HDU79_003803 [Rhizoclosmatium sp. JEL0117]